MKQTNDYRGLRFERPTHLTRNRLAAVVLVSGLFTVLWAVVPHSALYWLLLPTLAILAWMASYGWRQALAAIHQLLHRLEEF